MEILGALLILLLAGSRESTYTGPIIRSDRDQDEYDRLHRDR